MAAQSDRDESNLLSNLSFKINLKRVKKVIDISAQDRVTKRRFGDEFTHEKLVSGSGFQQSQSLVKINEALKKALVDKSNSAMEVAMEISENGGATEGGRGVVMNLLIAHDVGVFVLQYKLTLKEIAQTEMSAMAAQFEADVFEKIDIISKENQLQSSEINRLTKKNDSLENELADVAIEVDFLKFQMKSNESLKFQVKSNEALKGKLTSQALKINELKNHIHSIEKQNELMKIDMASFTKRLDAFDEERKEKEKIKSKEEFICKRGSLNTFGWGYSMSEFDENALELTVSEDIRMTGTGVFLGVGTSRCQFKIYLGKNGKENKPIFTVPEKSFTAISKNTEPLKWDWGGKGFVLKKGSTYTISHHQKGPKSWRFIAYKTALTQNRVAFRFGNALRSPNGTDLSCGQIPLIYFQTL